MTDMIADRYCPNLVRDRYTALDEVSSSLRRFRDDTIRRLSTDCDAGILDVGEAHAENLDTFVEYMRESYNRLERSILDACYGTEEEPTDGEPYWRLRAHYDVYWTSSEPDGSTFTESDSNLEGEWYFRSEIDALEWAKYLRAKDPTLDVDDAPRFIAG